MLFWFRSNLWILAAVVPLALPAYLLRFRVFDLPTTALEVFVLFLLLAFTFTFGWNGWRQAHDRLEKWRWPILAWSIVTLMAALWSPAIVSGIGLWRAYVLEPILIFMVLLVLLDEDHKREWLRRSLVAITTVIALWGVVQFASGWGIPSPWDGASGEGRRATGPFSYPNALALFVVPIGAWAFARWLNRKREWWLLVTTCAALVGVLISRSDGGLFALSFAIVVAMIVHSRKTRTVALIAVALAFSVVLLAPSIRSPVLEEAQFKSWSGRVRIWMWGETWEMLKDTLTPVGIARPILGAGFGGYPIVFKPYHKKTFIEIFQYPHNIVLNLWSETGLLGLMVFGWILVVWVREGRSAKGEGRIAIRPYESIAVIGVIVTHGLVDVPYFKNDLAIVFWILIFLTGSYKK